MSANPLTTGELRAALQRIVFIRLTTDAGPGFPAATIVAAQYWGQGKVVLTRFPDGAIMTAIAHNLHGELIECTSTPPQPVKNPTAWKNATGPRHRHRGGQRTVRDHPVR